MVGIGLAIFALRQLNTGEKISAKILADRFLTALPCLICPEQTCAVTGRSIQDNLHMVRIEKVDGRAALINLEQSKAFDRGWSWFSGGCSVGGRFRASLSQLIRFLCVPQSHDASERGKIEALHFDSVDSSRLSIVAHAVRPFAGTFPAHVEGEAGPNRLHVTWLNRDSQVHGIRRRCQRVRNELGRSGWGEQRNRKVWRCEIWFVGFYGISTFVGYLTPNPFLCE